MMNLNLTPATRTFLEVAQQYLSSVADSSENRGDSAHAEVGKTDDLALAHVLQRETADARALGGWCMNFLGAEYLVELIGEVDELKSSWLFETLVRNGVRTPQSRGCGVMESERLRRLLSGKVLSDALRYRRDFAVLISRSIATRLHVSLLDGPFGHAHPEWAAEATSLLHELERWCVVESIRIDELDSPQRREVDIYSLRFDAVELHARVLSQLSECAFSASGSEAVCAIRAYEILDAHLRGVGSELCSSSAVARLSDLRDHAGLLLGLWLIENNRVATVVQKGEEADSDMRAGLRKIADIFIGEPGMVGERGCVPLTTSPQPLNISSNHHELLFDCFHCAGDDVLFALIKHLANVQRASCAQADHSRKPLADERNRQFLNLAKQYLWRHGLRTPPLIGSVGGFEGVDWAAEMRRSEERLLSLCAANANESSRHD